MKRVLIACLIVSACLSAQASEVLFDEHANASEDLKRALVEAHASHKDVLLVFGANWCPDCRVLHRALHGNESASIGGRYVVVAVDVGEFDKNLDLAKRYEVPLRKGVPAAAVVGEDDSLRYVTKAGELVNARRMSESGIVDFLLHIGKVPVASAH